MTGGRVRWCRVGQHAFSCWRRGLTSAVHTDMFPSAHTDQLHEGVKPTLGELEKFQVTPEEMEQECESLAGAY